MAHQLAIGREVLAAAHPLPGAPNLSEEELGSAFERAYSDAVKESVAGRAVTPAEQLSRAARETHRDPDPSPYLAMLKAEVDRTPLRRAPGALELLADLRERGYRLGVISNTVGEPGEFLRPILGSMGFDRYVEAYVFSDEHPWTKPAPQIFRYALDRLNEKPRSAVHVGDGWADLEGARRAGYRGAVLFTGLHSYGPRYRSLFVAEDANGPKPPWQTDSLREVGPIVRKLLPLE